MSDDRLRELGKQLAYDKPDAERRESVRASLLVAAAQPAPSRKPWLLIGGGFAAGALAAAAIAIVVLRPAPTASREAHARASTTAIDASANIEHTVAATSTGTDEVVRIRAGVVRVAVPAIKPGDRVRMQTADAEVEGTGTYEVAVAGDHLERITVTHGTAKLRVKVDNQPRTIVLAAGQTWRPTIVSAELLPPPRTPTNAPTDPPPADDPTDPATMPTSSTTSTPSVTPPAKSTTTPTTSATSSASMTTSAKSAPPTTPSTTAAATVPAATGPATTSTTIAKSTTSAASMPAPAKSTPAAPTLPAVTTLDATPAAPASGTRQPSATEVHFQKGWGLLREGKAREAATELALAADAGGDDPLATDARYFQAIALVRAGDSREAERVLIAFLDHAPTSLRRGRAAVLLGRLLRDRGDTASAKAWFRSAIEDPDPAIASAAKAHLSALSTR